MGKELQNERELWAERIYDFALLLIYPQFPQFFCT